MSSANVPVRKECHVPGKARYLIWRTDFEIDDKYEPVKAIGKGAYGVVCSAKNTESGEKVAIKKITNAFENLIDARRTLREMKLLRCLRCGSMGDQRGWSTMGCLNERIQCICGRSHMSHMYTERNSLMEDRDRDRGGCNESAISNKFSL